MAEESAEKDGGTEQEKSPRKGLSPGLVGGFSLVVLGGIVGIFFLMGSLKAVPSDKSFIEQKYAEIDLDTIQREMSPSTADQFNQVFSFNPVLILNPEIENIEEIKVEVEKRKKHLRGEIVHLLYRLSENFFRKSNLMRRMSDLFLNELNATLGLTPNGKAIISRIVFSSFETPPR